MIKLQVSALLALTLVGCALPTATGTVSVRGSVVEAPSYALADVQYKVPYELKRLDTIEVWLTNTDDVNDTGSKVSTLTHSGTGEADHTFGNVELTNLTASANYKVSLKAFQIPEGGTTAIEVQDATNGASDTTFQAPATNASALTLSPGFKLSLKHQAFSATAQSNVSFTNGVVSYPDNTSIALKIAPIFVSATTYDFQEGCDTDSFLVNTTALPGATYQLASGTLPSGVTFSTSTHKLTGTPAAGTAGTYPLTFKATNSSGAPTQTFNLVVKPADPIPATTLRWRFPSPSVNIFPASLSGFRQGLVLEAVEDTRHGAGSVGSGASDGLMNISKFWRRNPSCTWKVTYSTYLTFDGTSPFEIEVGTLALTGTSTWTFTPNSLGQTAVRDLTVEVVAPN